MKLPSTGNKTFDYNFNQICKEIDALQKAVNPPQVGSTQGKKLDTGNVRFIKGLDGSGYLEVGGDDGVYTTFQDALQLKGESIPYADLRKLTVKDLFASSFTVRQLNAVNGDYIFSDTAEVSLALGNTITFKDQSNLGICPFRAGDKIITEKYANDKSSNTKYVKATVTSVSGASIVVSYNSATKFSIGDIVVRVGSSTDSSRRDSIYISTNKSHTPYIDVYDGIVDFAGSGSTYWENHIPQVRIGKGSGLNAGYSYGVYIGNGGELRILPGATVEGVVTHTPVYTMGDTFPVSPVNTDWHFYTKDPPIAPYIKNTWYKYEGGTWVNYGLLGTYITGTGIYTGTLIANQVISGTFTGLTFQTDFGTVGHYKRVEISASTNTVNFYDSSNVLAGSIGGTSGSMEISGSFNMEAGSIFGASGSTSFSMDYAGFIASYNDGVDLQRGKLSGGQLTLGVNSTYDVNLYRGGANLLKTDDDFTANKIIKTGGTSSQFLKADGSVDSSTYISGTPWTSEGYIVAPTPASGWLYNDGFGGYSWTEPTAADVGAAPSSHGNSNHSETYLTTSTEGWRTTDVTGLGNGIGNSAGSLYVKASGGLAFSGGDLVIDYTGAQSASSTTKGFLTSTDWNTFNGKATGAWGTSQGWSSPNNLINLTINGVTYAVAVYIP